MSLRKIIGGLILLTAILECTTQAQAIADNPKRREGEIGLSLQKWKLTDRFTKVNADT